MDDKITVEDLQKAFEGAVEEMKKSNVLQIKEYMAAIIVFELVFKRLGVYVEKILK